MKNQTVFSTISPHFYTGTTVKSISTDFSSSCSLSMTNFLTEESLSIDSDNTYSSIFAKDKFLFTGQSNGDFSIFDTQNFNKIFTNNVSQSDVHLSYNFNKNLVALNKENNILLFDINKESFFPSINLCNPVTCLQFNKKISHVLAIGTTNSLVLTDLRQKKILLQIATDKINQINFNSTHNTTLVYQSKNLLHSFDLLNDKKQEMFFSNYFTLKNELLFSIDDEFISVYDMSYNLLANKNLTNVYQISFSKFYKDLFCINYLDGTFKLETLSTFFNHKSLFTEQNNGILVYRHIKEPVISYDNHINTEEIKSIFEENSSSPVSKENEEELIVNTYTLFKNTTFKHTNNFKLNESIYYKLLKNTSINDLLTIKEKESFFDRKDPLLLNLVQGKITECINDSKGIQVNLSEVLSSYFSKESEFTNPCLLLLSLLNNSNLDLVLKVVHKNDWDILLLFIYNNIKCNLQLLYELGEKIECKEGSLLCYLLSKDLKRYINLRNNLPQANSIFKYYDFINEYFNFYYENKPILPEEETKTLKEFKSFINKTPLDEEKEIIDLNTEHFKKLIIKTQQENLKEKINTQKNQPVIKFNKINTEINQSENQMKIPKPSKLLGTLNEVAEAHNKLIDSQSKPISKPSIPFPTPINNPSKYSTNYNTKVINNSTSLQDNKSVEEESFSKPKIPYSLSKDASTNTSKNTYGSLKVNGPQISYESKQNIPLPTRNDSSPILPQINQNVCQLNTNVNQPINSEEIKNNINSIINYLKQESLNKKGLVYKSKTNSALKKLENYNVNSFNDPLLLRLLNYFNKINLEEIQNNKSNIKSKLLAALCFESDNICREMGGSGIEGFLQAVFALLQVVLA